MAAFGSNDTGFQSTCQIGHLNVSELKAALKKLQDEAVNVVKEEKAKMVGVTALKKAAKASQKLALEAQEEAEAEIVALEATCVVTDNRANYSDQVRADNEDESKKSTSSS